jgi:rare lipoprotein A (peptidoglycan hydrolase)
MRGGVPLIAAGQLGLTQASASEKQLGVASVYSTQSGSRTASGERLNAKTFTAAHGRYSAEHLARSSD